MGNYWQMLIATNFHKKLKIYRFWQPLGMHFFRSRPACEQSLRPTWVPERALGRNVRRIFATFWLTGGSHAILLRSRKLRESANTNLGYPKDPPGMDFERIFQNSLRRFGHSWRPSFVPTSSQVCPNSSSAVGASP